MQHLKVSLYKNRKSFDTDSIDMINKNEVFAT